MNHFAGVILIIDDTKLNLEMMKAMLQGEYRILTATNGPDGLHVARTEKIDLILLDVEMTGMDGFETCTRLKSDPATENIPVIFVTARDEVSEETKGLALGAIDYIIKPISSPVVKARVRNHVRMKQQQDQLHQTNLHLRQLSAAVEQSPVSVVITDTEANIAYVNPRFAELTGYTPEELHGKNPRILQSPETPAATYADMWRTLVAGQTWRGEFCNKRKNGELYWESASIKPLTNDDGQITHYVGVKSDITHHKQTEAKLRELSLTDELTGLANKEYLENKLKSMLASKVPGDISQWGILFVEIDNLREIAKEQGLAAADATVQVAAKTVLANLQPGELAARWDAGLFLLVTGLDKKAVLLNWANKIKSLIEQSRVSDYETVPIKICVGGLIANVGDSYHPTLQKLESSLKCSRFAVNGLDILEQ